MATVEKLRYTGPYDAVLVPRLGRVVARGDVIEVSAEDARSFLEQTKNWERVRPAKQKDAD